MIKKFSFTFLLLVLVAVYFLIRYTESQLKTKQVVNIKESNKSMKIISPAFGNNQSIPAKYTCNGKDINPPLEFVDVPPGTKSLTLIVDDPDAPAGTWIHWAVYNIDPSVRIIPEDSIPRSGIQGMTSSGQANYGGPCPPSGTHRYFFKLFALDKIIPILGIPDNKTALNEMQNSIIAKSELIGLYNQNK